MIPATIARGQTNKDANHIRIRLRNHLTRKAAEADRYTDQYTIPFKIDDNVAMIDSIIHRLRQTLHPAGGDNFQNSSSPP